MCKNLLLLYSVEVYKQSMFILNFLLITTYI